MANWSDLGPRVGSAVVMTLVGGAAVFLGGIWFNLLVALCVWAMTWELLRMFGVFEGQKQVLFAGLSAVIILLSFVGGIGLWLAFGLAVLLLIGHYFGPEKINDWVFSLLFVPTVVGCGLLIFRGNEGLVFILWMLLVVIASDVMGYFAGKTFGGPKFWPSISPKKTWSGTAAGWVGAALVGFCFVIWNGSPISLIFVSVLTSFAGQMGDIAESALKRKQGIKDSSNLIPGHGGVLDRFDAISGAVIFLLALSLVMQVSV
ncbi:phosphatidate cytidylyltransferase [Octadecabacter temperatus]|uniref:Phosphatidate cytidylyltransferase n=1 Tax=Octadecabacter temperatus TaxID=1458307 RepID=A0A0K0Y4Q2_9RHOB|nr:phosphatidate cytidylyltransferase [Octadecabacter temperatus]AKS45939.1 Phosphatidate cytidylyltransferase [Octadecabacter temperatus]SIO03983.1 phosphatidate cytidylyltransferase [Octadecabacter temperatus]